MSTNIVSMILCSIDDVSMCEGGSGLSASSATTATQSLPVMTEGSTLTEQEEAEVNTSPGLR